VLVVHKPQVRCAIYTRKSSEEGLEQSFNSLDAQREACEAYIASQRHEGWVALKTRYDDGGFSGGTMERPALKRLMGDISAGKIQTVVVYKVDRLTRALNDFAKIIETLDGGGVTFVSVTQQFNTTTSMGRLTLNVLLSFAQFEREVTGERIRDKIAASKKKGMWMGGRVPLGYDLKDRKLLINPDEAKTIREIFQRYLRLGCVSKLKSSLDKSEIKSKVRTNATGRIVGGASYSRGALYSILSNKIYRGEVWHRGHSYRGEHEAIITPELWEKVAAKLEVNNQAHRTKATSGHVPSPLTGLVFDTKGFRYTPTHALKNGKRYRYYTSQATIQRVAGGTGIARIPAHDLEALVQSRICALLASPDPSIGTSARGPQAEALIQAARAKAQQWPTLGSRAQGDFMRAVLRRVVVGEKTLDIQVSKRALTTALRSANSVGRGQSAEHIKESGRNDTINLACELQVNRRGNQVRLVPPTGGQEVDRPAFPATSLIKAVVRAHCWYERISSGDVQSIETLSEEAGVTTNYVRRILQCARLAPEIVESIVYGRQAGTVTLRKLTAHLPLLWSEQKLRLQQDNRR
jgi:site-specific DNA recombinase